MKFSLACFFMFASLCRADETNLTITVGNAPALVLTATAPVKVSTTKDMTEIHNKTLTLQIWHIPSAKTVDEGIAQIGEVIKAEVLKFAPTTTNALTVAGAPAKHLIGRGIEADDNDPATVDVVVFSAGKNIFAACVHGEGNEAAAERAPMLAVLKTVKTP